MVFTAAALVLCGTVNAHANTFDSITDWDNLHDAGVGYMTIFDPRSNANFSYTYTHILDPDLSGIKLDDAKLKITHRNNWDSYLSSAEVWFTCSEGTSRIGRLGASENSSGSWWQTDTFILSQDILEHIQGSKHWGFTTEFREDSTLQDQTLWLDKSELCGDCAPYSDPPAHTPEPATMSLLGLGLAGLLSFRRKRV